MIRLARDCEIKPPPQRECGGGPAYANYDFVIRVGCRAPDLFATTLRPDL